MHCKLCGKREDERAIQEQGEFSLCLSCADVYTDDELIDQIKYQNNPTELGSAEVTISKNFGRIVVRHHEGDILHSWIAQGNDWNEIFNLIHELKGRANG